MLSVRETMSGNGTGPKAHAPKGVFPRGLSCGGIKQFLPWATIVTTSTKIVYPREQQFIYKHNLDDLPFKTELNHK